ncbi:MAG: hypothetical protein ACT4OZ_01400 [Gemmatimonadota bacterium]
MTPSKLSFFLGIVLLAACVDSPASMLAPDRDFAANQPLADTFDELARQAAEDGDKPRSDEFTWAALAVRYGVTPSRLEVRDGNTTVAFDAIVTTAEWQVADNIKPPALRSIVAWRRGEDGLVRLLSVNLASDSAALRNPISLGPNAATSVFAVASATYRETAIGRPAVPTRPEVVWVGVSGTARIRLLASTGSCTASTTLVLPKGVTCVRGRFVVNFSITFQQVNVRPSFQVNAGTAQRTLAAVRDQEVNGYRLTFACLRVSSLSGCG